MADKTWTDEDESTLRMWWDRGLSASQISEQFHGKYSRKAICGKARRMKLSSRDSTVNRGYELRKIKPKPIPKPIVVMLTEAPEPCGIPGEYPDKGCQWIAGDVIDFIMCGAPLHKGSYCAYHHHQKIDHRAKPMLGTSRSDRQFRS